MERSLARAEPGGNGTRGSTARETPLAQLRDFGIVEHCLKPAARHIMRQIFGAPTNSCDMSGAGFRFSSPVYGGGAEHEVRGGGGAMRECEREARAYAKLLRRTLTNAETIVWSRIRYARERGYKFRRQHPIGPFVADFACIRARLVIEIDGATHSSDEQRAYDLRRDAYMRTHGWRVLRIPNADVYQHLDDVIDSIFATIPPPPRARRSAPPP